MGNGGDKKTNWYEEFVLTNYMLTTYSGLADLNQMIFLKDY